MDHLGLQFASREILTVLTPGYRPPPSNFGYGMGVPGLPYTPAMNTSIVDAMVRDYQVKLACSMKIVPIMKPKFAITGDPEVIEFVKSELRSIWTQCITKIATAMWYTRFGCEMVYKRGDDGVIRFQRMMPYHPRDYRILSKAGECVGVRIVASHDSYADGDNLSHGVNGVNGFNNPSSSNSDNFGMKHAPLFNPKCFVYVHDRRFGSFDGTSELEGAYEAWMEKVKEGGAISSRSLWFYKCAFDSGMIFHPEGTYDDPDHVGQKIPYRDFALKVGESIRNGSVIAVPSAPGADGNPAWNWIRPEMNQGGEGLLNLVDHLDGKINKGIGIPDDVIEQKTGSTTGGYAGRTIPFIAFLEAGTPTVRDMCAEVCRQVLVPEAQLNFGESRGKDWEITDAGVNTAEFLGEEEADTGIPNDGDNDGAPNEAMLRGAGAGSNGSGNNGGSNYGNGQSGNGSSNISQNTKQFSQVMDNADRFADDARLPNEHRKRLKMKVIADVYGKSSVKFVGGDGRRLGSKRASAAVEVDLRQMSHVNQPRSETGKFISYKDANEFSSTQFDLRGKALSAVRKLSESIPDEELSEDGREDNPHVTVKYGIHSDKPDGVIKAIAGFGPVEISLGKVSIFEGGPDKDYDVVKVDVDGLDIHRLNKLVSVCVNCTDTHPEYKPHVTLAYVKKGNGQKYVGNDEVDGLKMTFDEMLFSSKDRSKTPVSLLDDKTRQMSQSESSKSSSDQSGHWITIGGNKGSGDSGGCRVFIGRNGKILKGPVSLKGENIKHLGDSDKKDSRQSRAAHAKAAGISGRELSDDDARKFGSKAYVAAHSHAKDEARMSGVSTHDVLQNMQEAHGYRLSQHQLREAAKSRARELTGKNAGNLAKIENSYRDYSSVPGFDTTARTIAVEHPELGLDPDDSDTPAAVWELIREGKADEPKLHDRETARQAAEWVSHAKRGNRSIRSDHDADEKDDDISFDFGANSDF